MLGDEDRVPVGSIKSSIRVGCAGRVNGLPMYQGAEQGMGAAGLKAPLLGLTDSDWSVWWFGGAVKRRDKSKCERLFFNLLVVMLSLRKGLFTRRAAAKGESATLGELDADSIEKTEVGDSTCLEVSTWKPTTLTETGFGPDRIGADTSSSPSSNSNPIFCRQVYPFQALSVHKIQRIGRAKYLSMSEMPGTTSVFT
jgi:hypothetical protein